MTQPAPLGSVELIAKTRKRPGECAVCTTYARVRGPRIKAEIRKTTPARDRAAAWKRFMAGVHQRHLDQVRSNVRALGRVTALMAEISQPEETR